MKFDKNTIIGLLLLGALFFGYFWLNSKEQNQFLAQKKKEQEQEAKIKDSVEKKRADSIANYKASKPIVPVAPTAADSAGFLQALTGTEETKELDNNLIRVVFTNRGGRPKLVELKNYKGPDSTNVKMLATDFDKISYRIEAAPNHTAGIDSLYFSPAEVATDATGNSVITYRLKSAEGKEIVHQYTVKKDNYMIDLNITVDGAQQILGTDNLNFLWQAKAVQQQRDISYERGQSKIGYRYDGDFDTHMIPGGGSKEFNGKVNWVAVKQQFFSSILVSKNGFSSGNIIWTAPSDTTPVVAQAVANMQVPLQTANGKSSASLSFYFGPNDYETLKQYDNDMEAMVDLGSGIFAFVKYINRWIVIPAFNFFAKFTSNYGIVILLLTLFIRLLISPLTYKSYLSGAKMKVLRPEIEQLKAKHGGDQQAMSMEQMKLFREAGVNPLGGCIPALFQIPIFFALYSFFNSNVALRGQSFLWAKDLSQYDSILNFGDIPVISSIYGNHVSLFTITAVLTSFLISLYSMSMTPDQSNPVLKYMPYVFPFILLFVFNKLPAGLTWYYTVSNLITLGLQFVIQTYIIDHDKILAKMEANRKKPKTKSKWQERIEQMQEQQKQVQQRKNPSNQKGK